MSTYFEIGELVQVRDQNDWRPGFVTQLHPLKVQCEGWPALEFSEVRKMASQSPLSKMPTFQPVEQEKNAPKAKEANASSQSITVLVPNHLLPTYEPPIFYYQPPQFYYPQQAIYGYVNYTAQNYTMQQSVAPVEIPNVAPEQVKVAPKVVTPKHEEKPITSIVGNKDDFELPAWVKTIIPRGMAQ
eukprot:UN24865